MFLKTLQKYTFDYYNTISSVSVHNCALASSFITNESSKYQQRNSCSDNSKRSSLNEETDENNNSNNLYNSLNRKRVNDNSNKLSLLPSSITNEEGSDSEYDDYNNDKYALNKIDHTKSKNSSLIHKRSYRSESELANKQLQLVPVGPTHITTTPKFNHISVISYNESENVTTSSRKSIVAPPPPHKMTQLQQQSYGNSNYLKLSTTHKSVNSLLTPSNNINNNEARLHEINQPYFQRNQQDGGSSLMLNDNRPKKW